MGNQTDVELNNGSNINSEEAKSQLIQCEKAIISSCSRLLIPRVVINIILQFSEHWKWSLYDPTWSKTEKRKSKYFRVYDIHQRQLRLELRDSKRKIKSQSALKTTHFNRFHQALNTNSRKTHFRLNFFRYSEVYSSINCPVLEGFIHIGFISNMYRKSNGKKLYKTCSKKQGFTGMLSNGHSFIGLSSRVVYNEQIYGLYKYDTKHENGEFLKDDAPLKYDEHFQITVDIDSSRITITRLFEKGKDGKPVQYELYLPQPLCRFKNEKWYPMVSINPYKSRFLETGCQIFKGMML